jgi:hypothetical protein
LADLRVEPVGHLAVLLQVQPLQVLEVCRVAQELQEKYSFEVLVQLQLSAAVLCVFDVAWLQ